VWHEFREQVRIIKRLTEERNDLQVQLAAMRTNANANEANRLYMVNGLLKDLEEVREQLAYADRERNMAIEDADRARRQYKDALPLIAIGESRRKAMATYRAKRAEKRRAEG
jgi:hypothetical protein